ncbi:MAG: hypothetical protein HY721_17930 [Planctomycetes bacterium]|nr:hypothetical protein [Planctomycetota bacterium]
MKARGRLQAAMVAVLTAGGCASAERDAGWPGPSAPLPYVVRVVLPQLAQPGEEGRDQVPVSLARLEQAIRAEFDERRACTEVRIVHAATAEEEGGADARGAWARDVDVEIEFKSRGAPAYAFAGRSAWFIPNTVLWFLIGFPSFWVPDRIYRVRWQGAFQVRYPPARRELPEAKDSLEEDCSLHILERGWTPRALYTPPGLHEGPETAAALAPLVERWLVRELGRLLARVDEALPLDVAISILHPANLGVVPPGGVVLRCSIAASTPLEHVRLELDGRSVWEREQVNMVRATREPRGGDGVGYEYAIELPLDLGAGEHRLRVLALRSGEGAVQGAAPRWSASRTIRFRVGSGTLDQGKGVANAAPGKTAE